MDALTNAIEKAGLQELQININIVHTGDVDVVEVTRYFHEFYRTVCSNPTVKEHASNFEIREEMYDPDPSPGYNFFKNCPHYDKCGKKEGK